MHHRLGEESTSQSPGFSVDIAGLELIKKHTRNLSDHSNAFRMNKQLLYCVRDRLQIGEKRYSCYIYLNEKLRAEEQERFLSQMLDIEQKLKEPAISNKQDIETFLSETLRGWKTIFQITEKDGKTTFKRNEKGITIVWNGWEP
jgi:hypothetical protein